MSGRRPRVNAEALEMLGVALHIGEALEFVRGEPVGHIFVTIERAVGRARRGPRKSFHRSENGIIETRHCE